MTENIVNQKSKDAIKGKNIGSAQNRTCQNHRKATLIFPTKVIIKEIDAIKRRTTGKRNGTISNYSQI